MTKEEAKMVIQAMPEIVWKMMSCSEEEAIGIAFKALEELNLYEENGLCLIPLDVYKRQCEELDRLKAKQNKHCCVDDSLLVGVDFSSNDEDVVVVMRYKDNKMNVINMIRNEEAKDLYSKLIGC